MQNVILSKLDYQRLKERIIQARHNPSISRKLLYTLSQVIEKALLLESREMPANVITMNSRVKIMYLENQKTVEVGLAYPEQVNIPQNRISIFAPLATALLGSKLHDIITLPVPNRTVKIKVDRILYQPEAAGDFTL
ncbi:nucleoside diphosphate kinase regulator [Larkinella harenae]